MGVGLVTDRRPRSEHGSAYTPTMRRSLDVVLILGFLAVDFLFFHDILKPGETTSPAQYMTGVLSIPVLMICGLSLLKSLRRAA